jgi:rare lipoprotein A
MRWSPVCIALILAACSTSPGPRARAPAASQPRRAPTQRLASPDASSGAPASRSDESLSQTFAHARSLQTLSGQASYYSDRLAGHATASGAPYRPEAYTAAHRKLPLGTVLRITREDDGRVVYVRVNDRGPFGRHRILDLSRAAAERLGMLQSGVVAVRAEVVAYGPQRRR